MDFQTRAAAGRISEIVGPVALELDRMTRRKGMTYGAELGLVYLQNTDEETYKLVEAYTDGVNQYINQMSTARLPVEYKILNYRPEPWSPYKTVLLLKYMTDMLMGDRDLEYTNLRKIIGQEMLDEFFPETPEENDPVIEADRKWDFEPLEISVPEDINYPDDSIFVKTIPNPEPGIGSNNWAVAGSKTENGYPILANDPHLSLNLPSLWFSMQLTTPSVSAKGATLPGALGIISGFNENIAWGVTNATRDVRDWYSIQFKNEERAEYLYNDQWIQSTLHVEEIKIKGQAPFLDSVVYTHHGPVVYDKNFRSDRKDVNFALKWTLHMESNEQKTFLLLNKGENHDDYIAALDYFTAPPQNFVFASKSGDIAMKVQGKFPLKWKGQGKFLMDGNDPDFEWKEFIPNEHNASTLNPSRGFVSSTNQHSVDPSYPYYVFDNSFEHYRNRRLNRRLSEMSDITVEDMKSLQFDNYNLHAAEALPVMLNLMAVDTSALEGGNPNEYVQILLDWDYNTHPDQEAPALFQEWWGHLHQMIWSSWKTEGTPIVLPNNYETTKLLRNDPGHRVFDDPETPTLETGEDLVKLSFEKMVEDIETWQKEKESDYNWANYKGTSIQHLVPNFKSFSHYNVYTGGGRSILNATSERHGASWRMVVEMGPEINAFGIYPGGQSGNPGSKFYDNFIKKWANGEYVDFRLREEEASDNLLFSTKFTH
jgi:penicillin amidase